MNKGGVSILGALVLLSPISSLAQGTPLKPVAKPEVEVKKKEAVSVASIKPEDLKEYGSCSPEVRKLINEALGLTTKHLSYTFGSNSPSKGGMDCSGTVQHTLKSLGIRGVPRSSHTIYLWAEPTLKKVTQVYGTDHESLKELKPGHLMFWEGTYATGERVPPISHVMIYLGTLKKDGKGVMFGASSGRRYRGQRIHGVSVFDFKMPSKESKAKFVAYGPIPSLQK